MSVCVHLFNFKIKFLLVMLDGLLKFLLVLHVLSLLFLYKAIYGNLEPGLEYDIPDEDGNYPSLPVRKAMQVFHDYVAPYQWSWGLKFLM